MTIGKALTEKLSALWDPVLTKIFDVVDGIRGAFGGLADWMGGLWRRIGQMGGLWQGITEGISALWDGVLTKIFGVADPPYVALSGFLSMSPLPQVPDRLAVRRKGLDADGNQIAAGGLPLADDQPAPLRPSIFRTRGRPDSRRRRGEGVL